MRVSVRLLGRFEVTVDGRAVPASHWRRRPAASLVKLLALQPRTRLLREQVVDALWPDMLVEEAAPRLHKAVYYARTALGSPEGIVVSGGTVALFPDVDLTLDTDAFDRAAGAALGSGDVQAATRAVGLYGGDLLPEDLYEPWTEEARSRLRVRHLELLTLAGHVESLVAADPLDEEAHLALVRRHVEAGRRLPALAALDRMQVILDRELGQPPGAAAAELRQRALTLPVQVPTGADGMPPSSQLPAPRRRLIGREPDLAAVTALLREHRVVTVTGPGGMGKTSLALAVGRALAADGGPDEVVLADLAPVRDDEGVVCAVAEAAGVQGQGAIRVETLAANLAHRDVLLLLDNCEHLLDASAELVDAVLDAGSRPRLLVTSREPLRVDGEAEHRLGSLGEGSVELFVERAGATAGPGAVRPDDPRVAELCERLDGLPLAIELAAGQLRHLTISEVVARLDDRLDLLVGGRPKAGDRHTALTATIEWSHRLLSPESQRAFERLAVFPASFDLAAARAVVGRDPATVTRLVGDLVAKSLLVHDPDRARYRLLETIRLFAVQRLQESGGQQEPVARLRAHLTGRATAQPRVQSWLSTSLAARSRDDLDAVRLAFEAALADDDVSGAVDLALGLSTLWRNAASYVEGRRWVERLLQRDLGPRDRVWTLILSADVALGCGDALLMRQAAKDALAVGEEAGEEGATVIAMAYDAMMHLIDPDRASRRLAEAARRAAVAGEPRLEHLTRGYRLAARQLAGDTDGLREEAEALTARAERDYASYLCRWGADLVAMVDRDGEWMGRLMVGQRADLLSTGLRENWLTIYWEALALVALGQPSLAQLERSRAQAEAEGRSVDIDSLLVLAYAAACDDEWERAAELLGATAEVMLTDTAGYVHHRVLDERLVRPHLEEATYAAARDRGRRLVVSEVLAEHGLAVDDDG